MQVRAVLQPDFSEPRIMDIRRSGSGTRRRTTGPQAQPVRKTARVTTTRKIDNTPGEPVKVNIVKGTKEKPAAKAPATKKAPSQKNNTRTQPRTAKKKPDTEIPSLREAEVVEEKPHAKNALWKALRIVITTLAVLGLTGAITWYFLWKTSYEDAEAAGRLIGEQPGIFWLNYTCILAVIGVLTGLIGRPFLATGIMFALVAILGFANEQKYLLRAAPIFPEEIVMAGNAGELASFVDGSEIARLATGIVLLLIGAGLADHFISKRRKKEDKSPLWVTILVRLGLAGASAGLLAALVMPVINAEAPFIVPEINYISWDRATNYQKNGFLVGFLSSIMPAKSEVTEDYSEEEMASIRDLYREKKREDEEEMEDAGTPRLPLDEVVDNFIVILDESFVDPEILTKYYEHMGGDVVPNLHKIMAENPSGYMFSHEYGGGTANVEFEVETGLSNYWFQGLPYPSVIAGLNNQLSAGSWAKQFGFKTGAVHSYGATMYARNVVYPVMGIDSAIFEDTMTYRWKEGASPYINDRSVYREALDIIKENNEKQFLALVTVQNHAPYEGANYPQLNYWVRTDEEENEEEYWLVSNAWESIHKADQYLGEFVTELEKLDEKTVILWFGDHAPGTLDQYIKSDDRDDQMIAHLTPYFVYANFDLEGLYTPEETAEMREELGIEIMADEEILETIDLPIMTPNCLLNTAYDLLNVEKPALFYLVGEVCQEMPVFSATYYGENAPEATQALRAYELVNYDRLSGKQYWDGE